MGHSKQIPIVEPSFKRGNLLFDLPIAQRLTLGFLAAALITTLGAGITGVLRTQSLHRQSNFYQNLLSTNITLTEGENLLQQITSLVNSISNTIAPSTISTETLNDEQNALKNLIQLYDGTLSDFARHDLLDRNSDQVTLLEDAGHGGQLLEQSLLLDSTLREWRYHRAALAYFLAITSDRNFAMAQILVRVQVEPTNADALSALRALTRLEKSLSSSAADSVSVEERNQLLTTVVGAFFACIAIALIGLFISNTVVYRLKQLRRVAQAVEEGKVNERIKVVGRDEIADISKSVNSMLEMISEEEEITAAYQLREQFIASVSHELRNPLTEVAGWLEMLRDYHGQIDPETQIRFINNASYGCQDIMHLINNVLDAAQAEHQMKDPVLEEVSVSHVVQTVLDHLDPRETATHPLQTDIPQELVVWANEQYVRQVLRNLISNALKYAPRQTLISIRATRQEQNEENKKPLQIHICVQDAGPGIPPDEITNLFQKYKRLKRDNAGSVHGTGLGLYISKQLVESMNGQIGVESSGLAGEGSRFYFLLPEAINIRQPSIGDLVPPSLKR